MLRVLAHPKTSWIRPQKVQAIKENIDKWEHLKLKDFSPGSEKFNKVKKQQTGKKSKFTNYAFNDGLISRMDKKLKKLNSKTNIPVAGHRKWSHFSKVEEQMANRHMKDYLIIR